MRKKYEVIFVRVSLGEKELIKRQAERNGMTMNTFVRRRLGLHVDKDALAVAKFYRDKEKERNNDSRLD